MIVSSGCWSGRSSTGHPVLGQKVTERAAAGHRGSRTVPDAPHCGVPGDPHWGIGGGPSIGEEAGTGEPIRPPDVSYVRNRPTVAAAGSGRAVHDGWGSDPRGSMRSGARRGSTGATWTRDRGRCEANEQLSPRTGRRRRRSRRPRARPRCRTRCGRTTRRRRGRRRRDRRRRGRGRRRGPGLVGSAAVSTGDPAASGSGVGPVAASAGATKTVDPSRPSTSVLATLSSSSGSSRSSGTSSSSSSRSSEVRRQVVAVRRHVMRAGVPSAGVLGAGVVGDGGRGFEGGDLDEPLPARWLRYSSASWLPASSPVAAQPFARPPAATSRSARCRGRSASARRPRPRCSRAPGRCPTG